MSLTRIELEAIGGVALVVAALVGLSLYDRHQQAIGKASTVAAYAQGALVATQKNAAISTQREAAAADNLHETTRLDAARMADATALDALFGRMRISATAGSRRSAASNPGAAGSSPAESLPPAGMVPAELYLGAVQMAVGASKYADCLRTGGQLCANDHDSLTGTMPAEVKP